MPRPHRPLVGLLVVGLGTLPVPLDTAVNIAMPSITTAFALPLQDIRWIVVAYVLVYASLMLVFGRLGDLFGYRTIFQLGLLVSALGLLACALAPTYVLVLLGRMLQGVGAALALSCGPALATSLFEERARTRALGFYAGVTAAGSALGPLLGGLLIERWGWAAVFAFRIPIVVAALALSWFLPAPTRRAPRAGFDAIGAALLVACMSALLFAFAVYAGPFERAVPIALAAVGLVALALFLLHEARTPQPLIRLIHFRSLDFAVMNAMSIAVNFAAFSVLILVPYYLMLSIVGLGAVSTWTGATLVVVLGVVLVVQGVGLGLFQVAYADFVTARLPVADRGVAGSLTILTRTIGVVTGATGLTAAFAYFEAVHLQAGASPPAAFLASFQSTFRTVAGVMAGLVAISLLRPRVWLARA